MINLIVAIDEDNAIGKDGQLPWHLPADLAFFKRITIGHPIIMGRRTYESIGRALPKRLNIVVSRNPDFKAEGIELASSVEKAINTAKAQDDEEVFVIGGSEIFAAAMPYADRIYLTRVHVSSGGDRFFKFGANDWRITSQEKHHADDKNPFAYDFLTLERS